MAQTANLPGAARLELVDGGIHLDPKPALFDAMLAGWVRQQQPRFLKQEGTIKPRVTLVRRLAEFTNDGKFIRTILRNSGRFSRR